MRAIVRYSTYFFALSVFALAAQISTSAVPPQDYTRYFYCSMGDKSSPNETTMYYSNVFAAQEGQQAILPTHFSSYVRANVDQNAYGYYNCQFTNDFGTSLNQKNQEEAGVRNRNVNIYETNWSE